MGSLQEVYMRTWAPYFLKWPTFLKPSGPFVAMDLFSGQNPALNQNLHDMLFVYQS